jgi:NAD(P)-dependent dehydrogenase (short-subunit alcohol dehydrogenase family)
MAVWRCTVKIAIVTGASSGIGRAVARRFHAVGWRVVNLARRKSPDEEIDNILCELSDAETIASAAELLCAELRSSTEACIVHAAAELERSTADCQPLPSMRRAIEVNVVGPSQLNTLLLSALPTGSSVVFLGSTLSEKAVSGAFSYVISKHAVAGMAKATAQDMAGRGVHAVCVCPGFTDTPMLRAHLGDDADALASVAAANSFNRLLAPEEIAELVWTAHRNPSLNGSVLHANLGQIES